MKKGVVLLAAVLCTAGMVFAGGAKEQPAAKAAPAVKTMVMKFGHSMPTDSTRHEALLKFQEFIHQKGAGKLKVEIYPSGQLGKEAEMIEALKMGTQEGYLGGVFDALTPKLNLYLMPFFFVKQEDLVRVTKSQIGTDIAKDAEKYGLKMLAVGDGGSRHFSNNVRPVRTPADMKGLKMRTPPVESIIKAMEAMGANPVSIPYGETYMALKTGVADGQENPFMNIATMKFHEVQKYLTVINYQFHPEPFCVGLAWFNGLDKDTQGVLTEGAWLYTDIQNKLREGTNEKWFKVIKDSGVQIYEPTAAERKMFIDACMPVYDFYIKKGTFTQAELDAVRKIASGG
jgi:C4-dicarboxylate-binding protein DctP